MNPTSDAIVFPRCMLIALHEDAVRVRFNLMNFDITIPTADITDYCRKEVLAKKHLGDLVQLALNRTRYSEGLASQITDLQADVSKHL